MTLPARAELPASPPPPDERRDATSAYLVVCEHASSAAIPLPASGTLRIGRAPEVDLRLTDGEVAPLHARITTSNGIATLRDLDAGTLVNGTPLLGECILRPGDVISIGATALVFTRAPAPPSPRPFLDLPDLRRRLEEETRRSVRHGREVTLLLIDLGEAPTDLPAVRRIIERVLRTGDIVGWGGPPQLVVLLPETAGTTRVPAGRILRALFPLAPRSRAGFASCPGDGSDADTLFAGARAAAAAAPPGAIASVAEAAGTLRIGDRTVVAADPAMARLFELCRRLAASDLPVLITGETGAGKEIAAAALHAWSPRHRRRMLSINCAALPDTLLESELFGHERGAFSGAAAAKPGLLESAAGGTVFLDEIGDLSSAAQAKLLRVLETRRVSRLGSIQERPIDVRLVAATNRSLEDDVRAGTFRRDLFFRLNGATVMLPPLRDRPLDLPPLARAFLADACARLHRAPLALSPGAMARLGTHHWPGNIRELRNLMDFLAATVPGDTIDPSALPTSHDRETPVAAAPVPPRAFRNIYDEIRELERDRISAALAATSGIRVRAAELIGMPLRTFVTKMKEHQIDVPSSVRRSR